MADSGKASVSGDVAKTGKEGFREREGGVMEKKGCEGEGFNKRVLEGFKGWKLQKGSSIGVGKMMIMAIGK